MSAERTCECGAPGDTPVAVTGKLVDGRALAFSAFVCARCTSRARRRLVEDIHAAAAREGVALASIDVAMEHVT